MKSPATHDELSLPEIRAEICEMGRRLWTRGFCAGNEGNISYRLDDDTIICTPTMISKGFMQPSDLATVTLDLTQVAGHRPYTSEIRLHIQIYRSNPEARAVVHCHPPHATAFGMTHVDLPSGILPEPEIFLGVIPRAQYETPGSWEFAQSVIPFARTARAVILENHGTVTWDTSSLEMALWNTEILEAYCRLLVIARQIGEPHSLPDEKVRELAAIRERLLSGD